MGYQRSKAPLSLMEQLIMVFIFAFAAAVCLQAFVYSDRLSKDGSAKELASVRATEVAEVCKAYQGDLSEAAKKLSATVIPAGEDGTESVEKLYEEDGLRVVLKADEVDQTALYRKAQVGVYEIPEDGEEASESPIYSLDIAWQLGAQTAG